MEKVVGFTFYVVCLCVIGVFITTDISEGKPWWHSLSLGAIMVSVFAVLIALIRWIDGDNDDHEREAVE